jgi:ABC-type transport system involved in multi-copper enzyme maturation permease subunit
MSNSVSRWVILAAKITGNFIVFLAPFLLSLFVGFLVLGFQRSIAPFSGDSLAVIAIIVGTSVLFIAALFTLGVLVSSVTARSLTSMVTLLLIWVAMVLAIPKLSPMLAEIVYPIKPPQVIRMEKELVRANLEKELDTRRRKLFDRILAAYGADFQGISWPPRGEAAKRAYEQYDREVTPLQREYEEKIASEINRIEQNYGNAVRVQQGIAVNLSRLSPLSCFTYVVTELSGTGLLELENFRNRAERFQEQVSKAVYDNYVTKSYGTTSGNTASSTTIVKGFEPSRAPVPHMTDYRHVTAAEALKTVWVDILLLALYAVLFFAGAFVSFLRYDVR